MILELADAREVSGGNGQVPARLAADTQAEDPSHLGEQVQLRDGRERNLLPLAGLLEVHDQAVRFEDVVDVP